MQNPDDEAARLNLRAEPQLPTERPVMTTSVIRDNRFRKEMDLIRLHH